MLKNLVTEPTWAQWLALTYIYHSLIQDHPKFVKLLTVAPSTVTVTLDWLDNTSILNEAGVKSSRRISECSFSPWLT